MKNNSFARYARAYFIFVHFADVLVLSTTWNDLLCSCVDELSVWCQTFNFVFLSQKRWFQFTSRIVRTQFGGVMTLNNWKMIADMRSYIFRWRSRCCRLSLCLSSLLSLSRHDGQPQLFSRHLLSKACSWNNCYVMIVAWQLKRFCYYLELMKIFSVVAGPVAVPLVLSTSYHRSCITVTITVIFALS